MVISTIGAAETWWRAGGIFMLSQALTQSPPGVESPARLVNNCTILVRAFATLEASFLAMRRLRT